MKNIGYIDRNELGFRGKLNSRYGARNLTLKPGSCAKKFDVFVDDILAGHAIEKNAVRSNRMYLEISLFLPELDNKWVRLFSAKRGVPSEFRQRFNLEWP